MHFLFNCRSSNNGHSAETAAQGFQGVMIPSNFHSFFFGWLKHQSESVAVWKNRSLFGSEYGIGIANETPPNERWRGSKESFCRHLRSCGCGLLQGSPTRGWAAEGSQIRRKPDVREKAGSRSTGCHIAQCRLRESSTWWVVRSLVSLACWHRFQSHSVTKAQAWNPKAISNLSRWNGWPVGWSWRDYGWADLNSRWHQK